MVSKKALLKTNDENALPENYSITVKHETKVPVDQFKAFTVFEEDQQTDENVPPKTIENDCSVMSTSYTSVR